MATLRASFGKKPVLPISADTRLGAGVDSTSFAAPTPKTNPTDVPSEDWASSSYELLHGADVSELPDTVPAELFDEMFRPGDDTAKTLGK